MKKHLSPDEWIEEFKEFASAQEIQPPSRVSERVFSRIHSDLNPSAWLVFAKLALIHLFAGSVTLLFCPQFGIQIGGSGLADYLMSYGENICMLGCGSAFAIGTALIASLALRPEEIRVVRKTEPLQFAGLGLLSLGAFICFGGEVLVSFALFWLLGLLATGLATLELGWALRKQIQRSFKASPPAI